MASRGPRKVYLNGRFLTQLRTGVHRYSEELIGALDRCLQDDPELLRGAEVELLVPPGATRVTTWENISIRTIGRWQGHFWEQTELFLASRNGILISLTGSGPLLHPNHILAFHDANIFANPQFFTKAYGRFHRSLRPKLARRAKALITVSLFSRDELCKYTKVNPDKFTIIGNSAEHILRAEYDTHTLTRFDLQPQRYILCVGTSPNKNVALAIKAVEKVAPKGYVLVLVAGEGKKTRTHYESKINDRVWLKKLDRVTDSELHTLYKNAAVFLFPSRYEGFGVPPLEAMLLGCPVIASDATAMPEVLSDAALFFRNNDDDDLARVIRDFIGTPEAYANLAEAGQQRARMFTWHAGAKRLVKVVNKINGL